MSEVQAINGKLISYPDPAPGNMESHQRIDAAPAYSAAPVPYQQHQQTEQPHQQGQVQYVQVQGQQQQLQPQIHYTSQPQQGQPVMAQPIMASPVYAQPPPQYGQPMAYQPQQPNVVYMQQPTTTTYVIQQAPQIPFTPFQTDFCGCCDDPCTFCLALFFPCVVAGQNEELKSGAQGIGCVCSCLMACGVYLCCAFFSLPCIWPCYLGSLRSSTRMRYQILGDNCTDCLLHTCCSPCALTQEHSEILKRTNQIHANGNPNAAMVEMR